MGPRRNSKVCLDCNESVLGAEVQDVRCQLCYVNLCNVFASYVNKYQIYDLNDVEIKNIRLQTTVDDYGAQLQLFLKSELLGKLEETQENDAFQLQCQEFQKEIGSLKSLCEKVRVEGEAIGRDKENWKKVGLGVRNRVGNVNNVNNSTLNSSSSSSSNARKGLLHLLLGIQPVVDLWYLVIGLLETVLRIEGTLYYLPAREKVREGTVLLSLGAVW